MELEKLTKDNIEFLLDYLPRLTDSVNNLVEFLVENNERSALEIFPKIIEGLSWTIKSMSSLERIGIVDNIDINKLNYFLLEIQKAMEISDYVLVSDLFEYEINPILNEWIQKIKVAGE